MKVIWYHALFSSDKALMTRLANQYEGLYKDYMPYIKLNSTKLKEAFKENMAKISLEEVETTVRSRLYNLKKAGFNSKGLALGLAVDNTTEHYADSNKTVEIDSFEGLEKHYIGVFRQQRQVVGQLVDRLSIIEKINYDTVADKNKEWHNGTWIKDMAGKDPILWAIENNKKIENQDPLV